MPPAKRILCIHLPHWSIARRCRRRNDFHRHAIVVVRAISQRQVVIDASSPVLARGVAPGMSAAEARALCPGLHCVDHNPRGDRQTLDALGRWLIRFTPIVARGWDDAPDDSPAALFLDLTGCERLFGGINVIAQRVHAALLRFNIPAHLAVAPTPGMAWALAISRPTAPLILNDAAIPDVMKRLPIEALRLDTSSLEQLRTLGLHHVEDVLALPREQLPSRFNPLLLKRIDQLTGVLPEPLTRLVCEPPVGAHMDFIEPIEALDDIWAIFERLLKTIIDTLLKRNRGIRQLRLTCMPDRGWGREPVVRIIALSRPHRDFKALINLIRCELETVDCEHGFVQFRLDVPLHEPVCESQAAFFEERSNEEATTFYRLLDRLRTRLGDESVVRPTLVESYLPERAWRPVTAHEMPGGVLAEAHRPLTLFPMPIELRVICEPSDDRTGNPRQFTRGRTVHRLIHSVGPERIGGEWWRGHQHTRDYYDVEDETGRRFWIFRVLQLHENQPIHARWFLHGRFD